MGGIFDPSEVTIPLLVALVLSLVHFLITSPIEFVYFLIANLFML